MQDKYATSRLLLEPLSLENAAFVIKLVNTDGWIRFIGDRNVHTTEDAHAYIQKIIDNPAITYLVVKIRDDRTPVGIISFIKRDYLPHHDIGFAFLDEHKKQGYGYEAASIVLEDALKEHQHILATTIKDNTKSIQLLEKLGFSFWKEIIHESHELFVFISPPNQP